MPIKITQATKDRINNEAQGTSIYADNGHDNRFSYLESLAEDNGVPIDVLIELADTLGPEEDFDGLVVAAEDFDRYSFWQNLPGCQVRPGTYMPVYKASQTCHNGRTKLKEPTMFAFLYLTLPAVGFMPKRPILVQVSHVVSVAPRHIVHPEDKCKPFADKRGIVDGSWVETSVATDDSGTYHVVEDYDDIVAMIYSASAMRPRSAPSSSFTDLSA